MGKPERRDSARQWIRSGASVTIGGYAKRYGVDGYTAYDDLTAIGFAVPDAARRWTQRPAPSPRHSPSGPPDHPVDTPWIMLDGRLFFVVGHTPGGAPYGVFVDETTEDPCDQEGS
jgi:hypothetical protein